MNFHSLQDQPWEKTEKQASIPTARRNAGKLPISLNSDNYLELSDC